LAIDCLSFRDPQDAVYLHDISFVTGIPDHYKRYLPKLQITKADRYLFIYLKILYKNRPWLKNHRRSLFHQRTFSFRPSGQPVPLQVIRGFAH